MLQIKSFQVTEMTVAGFRGYTTPRTFRFSPMTEVIGGNARGKSSIGEAIAFAITGVPFFGGTRLDVLYHGEDRDITVDLSFIDGNNQVHRIYRRRRKDKMEISFDGMAARQKDLDYMFGERDLFLSIFNPLYLIEALGEQGAALLERNLPTIPDGRIMETLNEVDRAVLEGVDLVSPSGLIQRLRTEIRETEEKVIYLRGQGDLLLTQWEERREALRVAKEAHEIARTRHKELSEKRIDGVDVNVLNETLADLYARHDELCSEAAAVSTTEIDKLIQKAIKQREMVNARSYQSQYIGHLANIDAEIESLRKKYSNAAAMYKGLKPGMRCPTCLQTVTEQNIEDVRGEWKKVMDETKGQGENLAEKRTELLKLDEDAKKVFDQFKQDDVVKAEQELAELNDRREALLKTDKGETRQDEINALVMQIRAAEELRERGYLTEEEWGEFNSLSDSLLRLESEAQLDGRTEVGEYTKEDTTAKIDGLNGEIKEKERRIYALERFQANKAELLFSGLQVNKVSISLYELVKTTGERKDAFKFTYDGRPYQVLSASEKTRAGLEVSVMLQRLAGLCFPVFIDNAEGIEVIDNVRPSGQCIIASMKKGEDLQVQPFGQWEKTMWQEVDERADALKAQEQQSKVA